MIHRGLLVILQSILWAWVIAIAFITIFVKWTNERYIFYYFILNNNDNCNYDTYVSYMSFIIICLAIFEWVICCHFSSNMFEMVKEWHKVPYPISIYISIVKFMIPVTSKQQTTNSQEKAGVSWLCCVRSQYSFKPPISGKLRESTTVSS